jgi:poly-gamma-glutamate biosynthesis protein PgsC/CapC
LLFSELFGLAAGGMVVPGYIALYLDKPLDVVLTLGAALATYLVVHLMSTFVIVYGKRRTVLMILVGYLIRMLIETVPYGVAAATYMPGAAEVTVIGYIIPGLIAIWIDRQGLVETLSSLITASVIVRLILILIFGAELIT